MENCDRLVVHYFNMGFTYCEIVSLLLLHHGIRMTYWSLVRALRRLRLRRNLQRVNWHFVLYAIEQELRGTGENLGYRSMQARLRLSYGISLPRESVRLILGYYDPDGVQGRRRRRLRRRQYLSRGPGFVYHIDGWDKLKRYGLCVHGCIDGFSRKLMWLEACSSNKDPYIVCQFFVKCVRQQGGIPYFVRSDRGTENRNIELLQTILHRDQERTHLPFLYGSSPSNQRIECWWSIFPLYSMQRWINHFRQMESVGIIDTSSNLHIECIRFLYMELLKNDLNLTMTHWNTHYLRRSRNSVSPHGKPDIMYYVPELYQTRSYLNVFDSESLDIISDILTRESDDCTWPYREIFQTVMEERLFSSPETLEEAAERLVTMLDIIETEMQQV